MLVKNFCFEQKINIQKGKGLSQKINELMYRYEQKRERQLYQKGLAPMNLRRAQTRTKIQIGGLVYKAGLLEPLGIHPGDDLQKDEQKFDAVATLMGALLELSHPLYHDGAQKILWQERGKKALAN